MSLEWFSTGVPAAVQQDWWPLRSAGRQIWHSGLRIWCCPRWGVGCHGSLNLIAGPGTPYAAGEQKRKKKNEKKKIQGQFKNLTSLASKVWTTKFTWGGGMAVSMAPSSNWDAPGDSLANLKVFANHNCAMTSEAWQWLWLGWCHVRFPEPFVFKCLLPPSLLRPESLTFAAQLGGWSSKRWALL